MHKIHYGLVFLAFLLTAHTGTVFSTVTVYGYAVMVTLTLYPQPENSVKIDWEFGAYEGGTGSHTQKQ